MAVSPLPGPVVGNPASCAAKRCCNGLGLPLSLASSLVGGQLNPHRLALGSIRKMPIRTIAKGYCIRFFAAYLACTFWMLEGRLTALTKAHLGIAFKTAIISATILLFISLLRIRIFSQYQTAKAALVATVTAFADYLTHASHFGFAFEEAIFTGISTAGLAFVISILLINAEFA